MIHKVLYINLKIRNVNVSNFKKKTFLLAVKSKTEQDKPDIIDMFFQIYHYKPELVMLPNFKKN